MKRSSVRRLLATLLSLLVVISMFTVCGLGVLAEDTIVADWNHRDVLSDSSRDETYASGGEEVVIGAQTSANTWDIFNEAPWDPNGAVYTGRLDGVETVTKGDILRMELDMATATPVSNSDSKMAVRLCVATHDTYDNTAGFSRKDWTCTAYNALEEKTSPYGYTYRTLTTTLNTNDLEDKQVTQLNTASGARLVVNNSQITDVTRYFYRLAIINETTGTTLYEITGQDVLNEISGKTEATPITATESLPTGGIDAAADAIVRANKDITLDGKAATVSETGLFTMNFAVAGEADKQYTVTAYSVDGDTMQALGSKTFTATGEAETVAVSFASYGSSAADRITFGITTGEGELKVDSVTLALTTSITDQDVSQADTVTNAIDALPEAITLDNEVAVSAAREAYNALTEAQKALVPNLDKLNAAEDTIAQLKQNMELEPGDTVATWTHKDVLNSTGRDETYASGGEEVVIGGSSNKDSWDVISAAPWENTIYTGALPTVQKGDILRADFDMSLTSEEEVELEDSWIIVRTQIALHDNFDNVKGELVEWYGDMYKELEENTDPVYGYTYRTVSGTFDTSILDEKGWNDLTTANGIRLPVINSQVSMTSGNKITRNFYRITLVNETTDEVLYEISGQELVDHMAESFAATVITGISPLPVGGIDAATDAIVRSAQDIVIDGKTATASKDGLYTMNFAVTGKADRKYTLTAYTVDGETTQAIGSKEFTATGEAENIALDFAVIGDTVGKKVTFGIFTGSGELTVETVELKYAATLEQGDIDKANEVIAAIGSLPETVALDNEADVTAARTAYDALTDTQKTLVNNLSKLTAAEGTLAALKADKEAADAVIAKIDALPVADAVAESDKTAIEEARAAYNGLTDAQKALVGEDKLNKLTAAEEALDNVINPPAPAVNYGDINGDGEKNASDALLALQHSVKLTKLEGDTFTAADVDKNDEVNASDALYILQYSVKLIEKFPAEQ